MDVICDLCGNKDNFKTLLAGVTDNSTAINGEFNIYECLDCSHCFIDPIPANLAEAYVSSYYTHIKASANFKSKLKNTLRKICYSDKYFVKKFISSLVSKYLNEPPRLDHGSLCDVGCGNGQYLSDAEELGWQVYGVDFDPKAVECCIAQNMIVKLGNAENIPFETGQFDVVRLWNVLEHTRSPKRALIEINRVLKPNGYIVIYVPNINSVDFNVFKGHWWNLEIPRHLHHFKPLTLNKYMSQTGFIVRNIMCPGTVSSNISKTIEVLKRNKVGRLVTLTRVFTVIISKIYFRLIKKTYEYDAGISILAQKVGQL